MLKISKQFDLMLIFCKRCGFIFLSFVKNDSLYCFKKQNKYRMYAHPLFQYHVTNELEEV